MTKASVVTAAYATARRTLPPLRIIVELYDMVLTSVAHARAERGKGNFEREFEALSRAAEVLQGLDLCLSTTDERAGPLNKTLHAYYRRTLAQLHAAKRARGDAAVEKYASVHRQVVSMREAWAKLAGCSQTDGLNSAALAAYPARNACPRSAWWA